MILIWTTKGSWGYFNCERDMFKRLLLYCSLFFGVLTAGNAQTVNHTFTFGDTDFLLDGKPLQMISGEMHYTRIPREYWRERMKMAKAMGLNTIGTYVFWNAEEPEEGKFDFTGNNDIPPLCGPRRRRAFGWC